MPLSTVNLVDREYGLERFPKNLRSIRYKKESYSSTCELWKKFRASLNKMPVVDAPVKESHAEVSENEESTVEQVGGVSKEADDSKIISRLGEMLEIRYEVPSSPKFVNNRAIKLKDSMMKNTSSNSHNIYSFSGNNGNLLFENPDRIVAEEMKKTSNDVQNMMNGSYVRDDIIVVPDRQEVQKTVDKEFAKLEDNLKNSGAEGIDSELPKSEPEYITREEVAKVVGNSIDIDRDKIKDAVDEAINGINVSKNGASNAKIEKYAAQGDSLEKAEDKKPVVEESKPAAVAEVKNEESSSENKNVHFDYDIDSISAITSAADKTEFKDDIKALLERVSILKQKQSESKIRALKAKEKAEESETMKKEAKARLQAYEDALKEDLGYNEKSAEENMKKAKNNEELVEAMLSMIQPTKNEASKAK